jgi:putative transposase
MEKAYKFRIYPNKNQIVQIQKTFGCTRFVYNHYLAKRIEIYTENGAAYNYNACSGDLKNLKAEFEWLKEVDSIAIQSSLKDLEQAYQNFFNEKSKFGFPKFKSKRSSRKSYKTKYTNNNITITDKHIKLPKLGLVKAAISKQVQGRILNATVSQNPSGKYFVSICCIDVDIPQCESTGAAVGIDLGLKSIAVTSDGKDYANQKHLNKSMSKLKREQRRLSRKQTGSNNRAKQRVKVAKVHERAANQRLDAIHKMTGELVKEYDVICIEDLAVKNMIRNRKLAKAISDAAWGEIRRQLAYKCTWQHKPLVVVDRFFPSSRLCGCGYKNAGVKDLSVRYWVCPECGMEHDRDINAAVNILSEGIRLLNVA